MDSIGSQLPRAMKRLHATPGLRFSWQDLLAPSSVITLTGLCLCLVGTLQITSISGVLLILIGRLCDLVDGPIARRRPPTYVSTVLDPIADKIALTAILVAATLAGSIPFGVTCFIAGTQTLIAILAVRRSKALQPIGALVPGKLTMFTHNIIVISFIAAQVLTTGSDSLLYMYAQYAVLVSIPVTAWALITYSTTNSTTNLRA